MKPWIKWSLVVLVLVVAGGQVYRTWTKFHPARAPIAMQPPGPPPPPTPDQVAPPKEMIWPDGSLNFQADLEASKQAPAKVWELLQAAPPAAGEPRDSGKAPILVFPFRDVTAEGVGIVMTQGWHPVGTGALALWTNANLLSPEGLWSCSAPKWDATATAPKDAASWAAYIRQQQVIPSDAVVISGVYRDGDTTGTPVLDVFWMKPGEATPQTAFTDPAGNSTQIVSLMKAQRREARMLADFAVKSGLATENKGSGKPPAEEFDAELRRIVIAANSRHSWLVQEAVNRSLALARRYPQEQAPLQAAAYAQTALRMSLFTYWPYMRREDIRSTLRALATAQLARQLSPTASGPEVLAWINLFELNIDSSLTIPVADKPGWNLLSQFKQNTDRQGMDFVKNLPDWYGMQLFAFHIWFIGNSPLTPLRDELMKDRENCDLLGPILQSRVPREEYPGLFTINVHNAEFSFQEDVQNFLALNICLLAPEDAARAGRLATKSATLATTPPSITSAGIGPADFVKIHDELALARRGWYDAAQGERGRWAAWDSDGSVYHKLLELCVELRKNPPAALNAPSPSGFAGIEYSPALRWHEYSTRLEFGITAYLGFVRGMFGSEELWSQIAATLDPLLTEPGTPYQMQNANYADYHSQTGKDVEKTRTLLRSVAASFPADWQSLHTLAALECREGDPRTGFAMIRECERLGRHNVDLYRWIGGFFEEVGCRRLAIKAYERYLVDAPSSFDTVGRISRLRTMLGDKTSYLAQLQAAADGLPGNNELVNNLIDYQTNVLKDYAGALANYEKFRRYSSARSTWPLMIALASGDTSNTATIVEQMRPTARDNSTLAMASFHARKAAAFRKIGLMKKAGAELQEAQKFDWAKGDVMRESMEQAAVLKRWKVCKDRALSLEDRYGEDSFSRLFVAESYWNLNRKEQALETLTDYLKENPRDVAAAPKLIRFLGALDRKEDALEVAEWALLAPGLPKDDFDGIVHNLKDIDAKRSAEIERDRVKFLGGPNDATKAMDWMNRHNVAPLPKVLH